MSSVGTPSVPLIGMVSSACVRALPLFVTGICIIPPSPCRCRAVIGQAACHAATILIFQRFFHWIRRESRLRCALTQRASFHWECHRNLPSNLTTNTIPNGPSFNLVPSGQLGITEAQLPSQPIRGTNGTREDISKLNGTVINGGDAVGGEG